MRCVCKARAPHLFFLHTLSGVPMVRQKMSLTRFNPLECLRTGSALIWPHVGMDPMVSLHIIHPRKRQTAIWTRVGLLAQVCGLVRLQVAGSCEQAATFLAWMQLSWWFFGGVWGRFWLDLAGLDGFWMLGVFGDQAGFGRGSFWRAALVVGIGLLAVGQCFCGER